jgi:homoserine O-acetyltransferase
MPNLEPTTERDVAVGRLALDCGVALEGVVQRVTIYGKPRPDGSNVVFVAHALTGSSRVADWWPGVIGPGALLDTNRLAVVGVNALGGCYGSTGPATLGPDGRPYGASFPIVTVGDIVRAQRAALERLGISRVALAIGGSLGGMQALEWALSAPRHVEHAIVVGAYDSFSAMGIALNAVAREAIRNGGPTATSGIELARKIAMLTYKSDALFSHRFGRRYDRNGGDPTRNPDDRFDVEGYLNYQGSIFAERMDDHTYLTLTRAMDLFDTRDRRLERPAPALTFVGISSDWLFRPEDVRRAAERFASEGADSVYLELESDHGHDAFLAEPEELSKLLASRFSSERRDRALRAS